jgi:hypothetical protein
MSGFGVNTQIYKVKCLDIRMDVQVERNKLGCIREVFADAYTFINKEGKVKMKDRINLDRSAIKNINTETVRLGVESILRMIDDIDSHNDEDFQICLRTIVEEIDERLRNYTKAT